MGVDATVALRTQKGMGEFVKDPSSSIEVPVALKLRRALQNAAPLPETLRFGARNDLAAQLAISLLRRLAELVDLAFRFATGRRDPTASTIEKIASAATVTGDGRLLCPLPPLPSRSMSRTCQSRCVSVAFSSKPRS